MKDIQLAYPTEDMVRQYNSKFDTDPDVSLSDITVKRLFAELPENRNLELVLRKVIVLNQLYNTRLWTSATITVARRIVSLSIDARLKNHDLRVVADIALNTIKGKNWRFYSFASKYCSFHQPEHFPIYDQYVDRLLNRYRRESEFATFSAIQLKDYETFNSVVLQFRKFYRLEKLSIKEMDKFLWAYGTEVFATPTTIAVPEWPPPNPPNPH